MGAATRPGTPRSRQKQAGDAEAIAGQAAYAASVVERYASNLPADMTLTGARVLELGPGGYLAASLLLAGRGARVTVADPYLPEWDHEVHAPLCRALIEHVGHGAPHTSSLEAAIAERNFAPAIQC